MFLQNLDVNATSTLRIFCSVFWVDFQEQRRKGKTKKMYFWLQTCKCKHKQKQIWCFALHRGQHNKTDFANHFFNILRRVKDLAQSHHFVTIL